LSTMDQDFPIRHSWSFGGQRNRLAEYLAADVLVAAGSATLVTPAVMILDRLVSCLAPVPG
jgi:hypothetical protein